MSSISGISRYNKLSSFLFFILFFLIIFALLLILGKIKHKTDIYGNRAIVPATKHTLAGTTSKFFYGSNVDMSQLLPTSPYYITNSKGEDLIDIAHKLGINTLRISSVLQAFSNQTPDVIYTKDQWDTVLNKMHSYNMRAIVLTETHTSNKSYSSDTIPDDYLHMVQTYIIDAHVGDNPAVYGFDIKNEPSLSTANLAMLKQVHDMLKQHYPNIPITVGGWKVPAIDSNGHPYYRWNEAQDAQLVSNIVDFYSPHIYGFDRAVHTPTTTLMAMIKGYLNAIELVANNKPIVFSEFGTANGDSVSDQQTVGSKELQANTYYAMYQTLSTYGQTNILGSIGYVLYSRNQFPDSWAIVKNKGDYIYPAAYVLQKFSLGASDISIPTPYTQVPDNIVLADKDNLATKSAHINDVVLLGYSGVKTNQYKMTITPPDSINLTQDLSYNGQFNKFFAIFSPKKTGIINVTITQTNLTIPTSIYTTTLSIN